MIATDYVPMRPFGAFKNPYWVTFCREEEIQGQLTRYGLVYDDLCGITTGANALLTSFQNPAAAADNAILVDGGAEHTTVVLVHGGKGVFAPPPR